MTEFYHIIFIDYGFLPREHRRQIVINFKPLLQVKFHQGPQTNKVTNSNHFLNKLIVNYESIIAYLSSKYKITYNTKDKKSVE